MLISLWPPAQITGTISKVLGSQTEPNVSDLEVTLALLESAGEDMTEFFTDVLGREEDELARFKNTLMRRIRARAHSGNWVDSLFEAGGARRLRAELFASDGRSFCRRWREDMAALGIKTKVTTRHLLYSILGNDSGPLASALANLGFPVKDMHARLTRELTRVRRKRNDTFQLAGDTLFDSVSAVLQAAGVLSREREAQGIGAVDIHRAFLARQQHELSRLLPQEDGVRLLAVADYLEEHQADEERSPLCCFTVREIQDSINSRIFGQQQAVASVISWIKRFRLGIARDGRPAAVFLFLGPSGTGKLQLAKELARHVYGDENQLLHFEMGQFGTRESMLLLIGAPPGYVGYGEGQLTNGLRDHPKCVVLFDEIEKADVRAFDAVMRFIDEGQVRDPAGPVRDGRKCIIILTSNAGQRWLRDCLTEHPESREHPEMFGEEYFRDAMRDLCERGFRPECFGRVDERIMFWPFSLATCRQIVDCVLKRELSKFEEKDVTITIAEEVRDLLARHTFATAMDQGARGAIRVINNYIVSPAIDLLSDFLDRDEPLPPRLVGVLVGVDRVVLEVE